MNLTHKLNKNMKKIVVRKDVTTELAKTFGVSGRAVYYALNYVSKSPRADQIREAAINMGGRVYEFKQTEIKTNVKPIKVLDNKGNVVRTI